MGILSDFVFKDNPRVKNILGWIKELGILAIFIWLALSVKQEWWNGFNTCKAQSCLVCWQNITGSLNLIHNITNSTAFQVK
jgi:hypothetical protein